MTRSGAPSRAVCEAVASRSWYLCAGVLPEPFGAATEAVEVRAGEVLPVARRGDVHDPDVHAEPAEDLASLRCPARRRRRGGRNCRLAEHEVGLSAVVGEERALAIAADERHALATRDSVQRLQCRASTRGCGHRTKSRRAGESGVSSSRSSL